LISPVFNETSVGGRDRRRAGGEVRPFSWQTSQAGRPAAVAPRVKIPLIRSTANTAHPPTQPPPTYPSHETINTDITLTLARTHARHTIHLRRALYNITSTTSPRVTLRCRIIYYIIILLYNSVCLSRCRPLWLFSGDIPVDRIRVRITRSPPPPLRNTTCTRVILNGGGGRLTVKHTRTHTHTHIRTVH